MNNKYMVKIKAFRYDPAVDQEPHYDTFEVETQTGFSVYNGLEYITEYLDPTFAYYASCRIGNCAGCLARVNGKVVRTCTEMLTGDITIEPVNKDRALKDLVLKCDPAPEEIQ